MTSEDIITRIKRILHDVALEDGKISEDEEKIIASVISNMEEYKDILEKALEDEKITSQEKDQLFEFRMKIVEDVYASAREDSVISDDEATLLKSICKLIMALDKKIDPSD